MQKLHIFLFSTPGWAPPSMVATLAPVFILFFNVHMFLFQEYESFHYFQELFHVSLILNCKNLKLKDIIIWKNIYNIIYLTHQEVSSMMLMQLFFTKFQFDSHLTKVYFVNSWHFLLWVRLSNWWFSILYWDIYILVFTSNECETTINS